MNSENRNKVLIGFGALAIVLIAAIALWPPTFRSEEASGAIGAVQKHRAPQIAQKDVILGNEATRRQQKVLYADFFNDASKIQTLSATLAVSASSNEQAAKISNDFGELNNDLRHQFVSEMAAAVAQIQMDANKAGNNALVAQAGELAGKVASAQEISNAQMHQYSVMFASIEESANKTAQKSGSFELADQDLTSAMSHLLDTELAASKLRAAETELNGFDLNDIALADQVEYFSEIEAASAVLSQAEAASHVNSKFSYAAELLAKTANKLEVAALNNMEEQSAASIQIAHALNHMESEMAAHKEVGNTPLASDFAALNQLIASKVDMFRSEAAADFSMEVAEMGTFISNEEQAAKIVSGSAEAGAKFVYSMLQNEAPLQNALVQLDQTLRNGDMANVLSNEEILMGSVGKLQNELNAREK